MNNGGKKMKITSRGNDVEVDEFGNPIMEPIHFKRRFDLRIWRKKKWKPKKTQS